MALSSCANHIDKTVQIVSHSMWSKRMWRLGIACWITKCVHIKSIIGVLHTRTHIHAAEWHYIIIYSGLKVGLSPSFFRFVLFSLLARHDWVYTLEYEWLILCRSRSALCFTSHYVDGEFTIIFAEKLTDAHSFLFFLKRSVYIVSLFMHCTP